MSESGKPFFMRPASPRKTSVLPRPLSMLLDYYGLGGERDLSIPEIARSYETTVPAVMSSMTYSLRVMMRDSNLRRVFLGHP